MTIDQSDEGGFRGASGHRVAVITGKSQRRTVDLAVIGGGPAGAATAIRAARAGASVVVFEKGTHGRDKV